MSESTRIPDVDLGSGAGIDSLIAAQQVGNFGTVGINFRARKPA